MKKKLMFLLWLVSLGCAEYRAKELFEFVGNLEAWLFIFFRIWRQHEEDRLI